ncbi:MAG: hypothetical protein CMJ83_22990 [Planctomycetes bacterium]|nr:hypothetical protein [Planctomycetota bacterium]
MRGHRRLEGVLREHPRLKVIEEWDGEDGRGCIVAPGEGAGGFIELSQIHLDHDRYQGEFSRPFTNDKADLRLRAGSVNAWVQRLNGRWPFEGPIKRPWGNCYLWLRDPDGLKVAIFEGAV